MKKRSESTQWLTRGSRSLTLVPGSPIPCACCEPSQRPPKHLTRNLWWTIWFIANLNPKRFPSKEISVGSASVLRPQAKPGAKVPCRKCSQTLSMLQRHPHCNPLVGLLGILKLPCSERVTTNKVHTSKASTNVAHVLLIRFKTTRILLQFVLPSQVYVTVVLS